MSESLKKQRLKRKKDVDNDREKEYKCFSTSKKEGKEKRMLKFDFYL